MKKLLLSSMACLAFAGYANAQAPAEWQVGDDVTTQVGLGVTATDHSQVTGLPMTMLEVMSRLLAITGRAACPMSTGK